MILEQPGEVGLGTTGLGSAGLGLAGLGLVGRALAARAIDAGLEVFGCDPAPDARGAAAELGVGIVSDAGQLAGSCRVLVVSVLDDAQLIDVIDSILAATDALAESASLPAASDSVAASDPVSSFSAANGLALVINTVTCGPAAADLAARRCAAANIDFVEMPFSGSSVEIHEGTALAIVGATDAVFERWQRLLAALGPKRIRIGPPGTATRAKLASNLILGLNRTALAEGLAFAEALGLAGEDFLAMLRQSPAYSKAVDNVGGRMVAREFSPRSRLAQHRKDLALILAEGAALSQSLPLATAHAALLDDAIRRGYGEMDNAAVFAVLACN